MTGPPWRVLRAPILVPVLAVCLSLWIPASARAAVNPPYVDVSRIPLSDALLVGDPAAKHRLIVFSDPDCPYCAKYHEEIRKVVSRDPRIAFLVKVFPNNNSAVTYRKALSIVCRRSVKLLEDSFAGREVPPAACRMAAVEETMRLVRRLNIASTPCTVLPDGRVVYGFQEADTLLRLMAERGKSGREASVTSPVSAGGGTPLY